MRIMLDALGMPPYGGARTAAAGWVTGLAKFSPQHQYIVLVSKRETEFEPFSNLEQIIISTPGRLLPRIYLQFLLPGLVKRQRVDIVHFTRNLAVIVPTAKVVVNINDLNRFFLPGMYSRWDILYWRIIQARVLRYTHKIICISNQTRLDVIRWLNNYPQENIVTIFPAVKENYRPMSTDVSQGIKCKYGLPNQFLLYVGGLAKHKNVYKLVKAFEILKKSTTLPHHLVIVGGQFHTHNDSGVQKIAKNLSNQIIFTGPVPDDDLPLLYNAAEAFVFPSLYEGFGLAPLEAMACGTPVIASRTGSLPEALGQAAYWINDPLDEQAFATAMINLLQNQSLQEQLVQRGLDQAQKFSWQKTINQTLDVYESLIDYRD